MNRRKARKAAAAIAGVEKYSRYIRVFDDWGAVNPLNRKYIWPGDRRISTATVLTQKHLDEYLRLLPRDGWLNITNNKEK